MNPRTSPRPPGKKPSRKLDVPGWLSTDEQEIERRRLRAETEPLTVRALNTHGGFYGDYAVQREDDTSPYRVEIRALDKTENSCSCQDYRKNGLGTCKHIEAVLMDLRKKGARRFAAAAQEGSPLVEVYLSRKGEPQVRALWPASVAKPVRDFLSPFFTDSGELAAPPAEAVPSLKRALERAPGRIRQAVRLAMDGEDWAADVALRQERRVAREKFLAEVKSGKRSLDVLKAKLYPYQKEGMLHLAFTQRVLLADEMGLGKTIQAIAACELLRQTRRIERVLVVSPASLKTEWEEQIGKFTSLPARLVFGPRAQRLATYRAPSFFYLCNYEQAVSDWKEMNEIIAPDVVILDEAQRIKNWQTRTAKTIKRLSSPYAFVLTGTPLENRIDEVYSIVEFLDPEIFGPLFRFNREFYQLDERGRPAGFKNLAELHRRLRPVMLRRRKSEVEEQLPPRTTKNFFVGMDPEQRARYDEYSDRVARLVAASKRRPLTPEEFDKLQRYLACMRMICDTPFILDSECRICPKLDELRPILEDALANDETKIIVFSEWERMLTLARDLAGDVDAGFAWHTGSVPQMKRRAEINRFKQDPACRIFFSTDSGATGLNLQAANVVINLDLPWNPAKLEQRIARAWRKHQTRSVSVINLVCEDSIEHRMLGMLAAKQQLADGVLDGKGDLAGIRMPSGRAAFMDRLETIMGVKAQAPAAGTVAVPSPAAPAAKPRAADPVQTFRQDLVARLDARLVRLESHRAPDGRASLLAVVDAPLDQVRPMTERLLRESFPDAGGRPALELLDRHTYETIHRLMQAGILKAQPAEGQTLHSSPLADDPAAREKERRRKAAQEWFEQAQRKTRMTALLKDGGFGVEALPGLREAVELTLKAAACLKGHDPATLGVDVPLNLVDADLVPHEFVPADASGYVARLRDAGKPSAPAGAEAAAPLLAAGQKLLDHAHRSLTRALLR
jgi:superfamily II DNA or RNA helicase